MQKLNRNLRIMLVMSLLQGMVFYAPIATLYRRAAGLTVFEITLIESVCLSLGLAEVRQPAGWEARALADFRACLRQLAHTRGLFPLALAGALMGESIHTVTVFLSQLQYARCGWGDAMMGLACTLCTAIGLCGALSARCAHWLGRRRRV